MKSLAKSKCTLTKHAGQVPKVSRFCLTRQESISIVEVFYSPELVTFFSGGLCLTLWVRRLLEECSVKYNGTMVWQLVHGNYTYSYGNQEPCVLDTRITILQGCFL